MSKTIKKILLFVLFFSFLSIKVNSQCFCPLQGDINGSGDLGISDITYFVDYLFNSGPEPFADADCTAPNRGEVTCDFIVGISDLTYMVDYLFQGGDEPCNPCGIIILPDSDPLLPDEFIYLDENYHNAIYEIVPSVFIYTNVAGVTIYSDSSFITGDTSHFAERKTHDNDSAVFLQFITKSIDDDNIREQTKPFNKSFFADKSGGQITIPAGYCTSNGSTVPNTPIIVQGNQINYGGLSVNTNYPFAYGPPSLAERISNIINNPPPMLTQQQINTACGEGALSIANSRITSITQNTSTSYYSGTTLIEIYTSYTFTFMHSWVYDCPDGPQQKEEYARFSYYQTVRHNGALVTSTSKTASHHYTFP